MPNDNHIFWLAFCTEIISACKSMIKEKRTNKIQIQLFSTRLKERLDGWLNRWLNNWMSELMNGRTDRRMDERMNGWTNCALDVILSLDDNVRDRNVGNFNEHTWTHAWQPATWSCRGQAAAAGIDEQNVSDFQAFICRKPLSVKTTRLVSIIALICGSISVQICH
jgi:hypothetical protein